MSEKRRCLLISGCERRARRRRTHQVLKLSYTNHVCGPSESQRNPAGCGFNQVHLSHGLSVSVRRNNARHIARLKPLLWCDEGDSAAARAEGIGQLWQEMSDAVCVVGGGGAWVPSNPAWPAALLPTNYADLQGSRRSRPLV